MNYVFINDTDAPGTYGIYQHPSLARLAFADGREIQVASIAAGAKLLETVAVWGDVEGRFKWSPAGDFGAAGVTPEKMAEETTEARTRAGGDSREITQTHLFETAINNRTTALEIAVKRLLEDRVRFALLISSLRTELLQHCDDYMPGDDS